MKEDPANQSNVPELQELARLQAQMQRPAQMTNVDGSFELGCGTALLCFALGPYVNAMLPKSLLMSPWTAWITFVPLLCGAFAPYAIPKIIKRFITWPRTGYVINPNEVKLGQLVRLMVFGAALGFSLSLPFLLFLEIREALSHSGAHGDVHSISLHLIEFLVCATLAVYLGRKTVTKRQPLPTACDVAVFNERFKQTAEGAKCLRTIQTRLFLRFFAIPLLLCGAVFGVVFLSKSTLQHTEIHWPQLGALTLLVGSNAVLYLMSNAVAIKQYRWKWLLVAFMLIGPLALAPAIPYSAANPAVNPLLEAFPPVMLSLALVWGLSGAATLMSFIRHHPLPTEAA